MTRVIVAFPKVDVGNKIKAILQRNGFSVISVCTNGAQVIQEANELKDGVVICTLRLSDMLYWELKECLPPEFIMVVLASPNQWSESGSENIIQLAMPLKVHELLQTMEQVMYSAERARKRRRAAPRRRSAKEQELVDRAKAVLMKQRQMTEPEAHRYLQKTSMDNGTDFAETAQMILSMLGP